MLKQPNFFYSQPSTLPKEALAKFYLNSTFGLSFMLRSVALPDRRLLTHILSLFAKTILSNEFHCRTVFEYVNIKLFISVNFA